MPRRKYFHRDRDKTPMIGITVLLPIKMHEWIKELLEKGGYTNRSEFIRHAIKNQLEIDWEMIK